MPDDLSGYHQHGLTRTGEQKDLTMSRRKRKVIQAVCGLQEEYHDVEKLELIILEHVDSDNKERMKETNFYAVLNSFIGKLFMCWSEKRPFP